MQKFAVLLAIASVVGFQAVASAEVTHSYPKYYVNTTTTAPAIITQPAVIEQRATVCPAPAATTTILQPSAACPAPAMTVLGAPVIEQTLIQPAIVMPAGFTMDPLALRLYTGPRLVNTLTMPDANTFLRP